MILKVWICSKGHRAVRPAASYWSVMAKHCLKSTGRGSVCIEKIAEVVYEDSIREAVDIAAWLLGGPAALPDLEP